MRRQAAHSSSTAPRASPSIASAPRDRRRRIAGRPSPHAASFCPDRDRGCDPVERVRRCGGPGSDDRAVLRDVGRFHIGSLIGWSQGLGRRAPRLGRTDLVETFHQPIMQVDLFGEIVNDSCLGYVSAARAPCPNCLSHSRRSRCASPPKACAGCRRVRSSIACRSARCVGAS